MTLPEIQYPIYEVVLTSRGKTKFRPFLVKEQKILMQAVEGKDLEATVGAVKQIVSACVLDKLDVDALPMVDLELLFLNLRARSMGEIMDVYYRCTNQVEEKDERGKVLKKECGMILEIPVNLLKVKIKEEPNVSNKIALTDTIGVGMHYPSFDLIDLLIKTKNGMEAEFIVIAGCIDYIWDENGIYKASEAKPEEIQNFVMQLSTEHYEKLKAFVMKAPKVREEVKHECPKCKFNHTFSLEGLNDFFT